MRQLHPESCDDVDPIDVYGSVDRRPRQGSPWVIVNMIESADGATAVEGVSGGLGGPADKAVFRAIRAVADVVLVGAGTVRSEQYGPPRSSNDVSESRERRGQRPRPRLAIVTRSLRLDWDSALFADDPVPYVVTVGDADPRRLAEAEGRAEVLVAGAGAVDMGSALSALAEREETVVLSEGGPSLNADLLGGGVVDEVCLSLAPLLVGGDSRRIFSDARPDSPAVLDLGHVLESDGLLFLRYVVSR